MQYMQGTSENFTRVFLIFLSLLLRTVILKYKWQFIVKLSSCKTASVKYTVVESENSVAVKMFEMWNNVNTKLEQVQQSQSQSQQPHTSSGSIKGIYLFKFNIYKYLFGSKL